MRPRLRPIASLVAFATLAACASSSSLPHSQETTSMLVSDGGTTTIARYFTDVSSVSDTVPRSAAAVWATLPGIYSSLGIPLSMADSSSRIIGAIRIPLRNRLAKRPLSAFLQCGVTAMGTPRANGYLVSLTVLSQVRDVAGGKSVVRTVVAGSARDDAGSSNDAQCGSTGMLEQTINAAAATSH